VYGRAHGVWVQQAYVKPFNPGPFDLFGIRIALSRDGGVLAAGSPFESGAGRGVNPSQHDPSAAPSGAVYVFLRREGRWSQQAYLKAPNSDEYDEFGTAVALSGDGVTLAVAASGEDGGSNGANGDQNDNSVRDSGALFVF
jgi:FG-GAP repeat protein